MIWVALGQGRYKPVRLLHLFLSKLKQPYVPDVQFGMAGRLRRVAQLPSDVLIEKETLGVLNH